MAVPTFTVQAAFGSSPGASSFTWTTIHDDSSLSVVREMSYKRGRQNELNRVETGTGALTLKDEVSSFDPDNTLSVYYPNVRPYVPIRCRATIAGVTYELFQHFVERWPRTQRVRSVYTERSITTVDGFEWLARAGLAGNTYSQQLVGARLGEVLDDVGWASTLRDLDAGVDQVGAVVFADDDSTKALAHLLEAVDSENALVFIDGQGRVSYVERHALVRSPYTVSQATFRDAVSAGGGYPFSDSQPSYDLDVTFNEFAGTRAGGATQTAGDTVSQGRYGLRSSQFSSLVTTDSLVLSQAQWRLAQFKDPLNRLESITVKPGNDTACWQALLGLEVGERITVVETPPGFAAPESKEYVIQNLSASFEPGPASSARFTFGLWPADTTAAWWSAGDAANSLAGQTTRAAY